MTKASSYLVLLGLLGLFGCNRPADDIPDWPWTDPVSKDDPVDPAIPDDPVMPDNPDGPVDTGNPRYVWIDASANFRFYADDVEQIKADVKRLKDIGFTELVLDVRPTEGVVLYDSKVAPHASKLAAWVNGQYKMVERKSDFDYLQAFIDAGHSEGLRVNASINTFVGGYGGYYGVESVGPIYTGEIPAEWATIINSSNGLVSSFDPGAGGTVFLNPANDDVQEYVLDIIGEIASYNVDGIILDRCRFDDYGMQCEFSETTRAKFEQYLGSAVKNWPSDVLAPGSEWLPSNVSPLLKSWMSFRAKVIHDFVEKAAGKVHSVNPGVRFGCYVGAWYSSYYTSGVNWASPNYDVHKMYKWADSDYASYGYADHCDFMFLGCYAGTDSIYGHSEWTMQGFAEQGRRLLGDACVFFGGPDIGNSPGFENGGCESMIPKTVDAIIDTADGYFCFDLCHIRMFDYWSAFKAAFDNYISSL